ncbi:DoxX family protein [Pseudogracilibacillus sp. SO30301A]|uniref:DoxX family protein n=1 Tax=Pseudogracilibacillus sp. SO30301A TaxID=3098291 RepID=UPI00300E0469
MQQQLLKWFRYAIGYVFISSGIVKLLVPDFKGVFLSFGLPFPTTTLFLVAIIEIACGAFIIARMYVKYAALLLTAIMIGALYIAKLPLLLSEGILSFVFESRLDIVMLILLIFLWRHHEEV